MSLCRICRLSLELHRLEHLVACTRTLLAQLATTPRGPQPDDYPTGGEAQSWSS